MKGREDPWPDGYPGCGWLLLILLGLVVAELLWIVLTVYFSILMSNR